MTTPSIAIMLLGNAQAASSRSALQYAQAAIAQSIRIECVFFYHDAVLLASTLNHALQDELSLANEWQQLIENHHIPAIACIASAIKRGVYNEVEAKRYQKSATNLHPSFELAGLGSWLEAVDKATQHVVFG